MSFKKIISLSPAITETLFFLKLGHKIIGVTEQCARMKQAKNKEKVGSFLHPDQEKIISLNPDLVIVYKKIRDEFLLAELTKRNITVLIFAPAKVSEIFDEMEKIGDIVGSGDSARYLVSQLRKRIEVVKEKISGRALPKVSRLMRGFPLTVPITIPSPDSYQYDAIIIAGGRPMFSAGKEVRIQVTFEDMARFNPQLIIRCETERPTLPRMTGDINNGNGWKDITAVKDGRIFSLPCELSCRAGPGVVDSIERMAGFFYPEVF